MTDKEKICEDCGSELEKYVMYRCPKCDKDTFIPREE